MTYMESMKASLWHRQVYPPTNVVTSQILRLGPQRCTMGPWDCFEVLAEIPCSVEYSVG